MASTIDLQTTINYARIMLRMQPLSGVAGFANEPAVSIANQVLQYLLAPPLAWPWNRASNNATATVAGTQDYPVSLPNFGWLEKAVLTDSAGKNHELTIKGVLPDDKLQQLPTLISTQDDNGAGSITFRLFPVPDAAYTLTLVYQMAAPLFAALTQTWAPVPDRQQYLYTNGFMAKAYEMADDPRFAMTLELFLNQIVGANNGLAETEKNLFLRQGRSQAPEVGRLSPTERRAATELE